MASDDIDPWPTPLGNREVKLWGSGDISTAFYVPGARKNHVCVPKCFEFAPAGRGGVVGVGRRRLDMMESTGVCLMLDASQYQKIS